MANIALKKTVQGEIYSPEEAVDGEIKGYTGTSGFAYFFWPGYLTVDLGDKITLYSIRILLWDGMGKGKGQPDSRVYRYRLLSSIDNRTWKVLYDNSLDGSNGWQVFNFKEGLKCRYVRIHGLHNSVHREFHVVQIEAYDEIDPDPPDADIRLNANIALNDVIEEEGDGLPIESKVRSIINDIEKLGEGILNPELFRQLMSDLRRQVKDISAIERSMVSIRREITDPVNEELRKASKLGKFSVRGFWVGIVGGILAIISLLVNFSTINQYKNILPDINKSIEMLQEKSTKILETVNSHNDIFYSSNNLPYIEDYISEVGGIKLDDIHSMDIVTHTIKKGESYTDFISNISCIVSEIKKDNTANISFIFPSGFSSIPYMSFYEDISSGNYWDFESNYQKYKISIIDIDFSTKSIKFEIQKIKGYSSHN